MVGCDNISITMGCGPSKKEFSNVQEATGMTKKEVAESFKAFKKEAGASKIKIDKFTKLVASMNTNKGKIGLEKLMCTRLLVDLLEFLRWQRDRVRQAPLSGPGHGQGQDGQL